MSTLMPVECRTCGLGRVTKHCADSSTCDLIRCPECQSFGNAKRWWAPESRRA